VLLYTTFGARLAIMTHYGPTRIHRAGYSLRHRRDGRAAIISATTAGTHLLSVMTTGRTELSEHGHRRRYSRGRMIFQGLRAGWSSGRTKPEYTAARGLHDHATFRHLPLHDTTTRPRPEPGPTRQSDARDSEPDYLLWPTRHGPGLAVTFSGFLF
jgi:hypothetical protein